MEFSRVGEHTVKCVISEEEIYDLGYTLDEIMSNGERTQEFMNHIFDLAEQEFNTKFDMGIKTVRADFLANHTLSLTFSEHPATEGMMEHLKDIVSGLVSALPKEIEEKAKEMKLSDMGNTAKPMVVLVAFSDFDIAVRFAHMVSPMQVPPSRLYKFEGKYYIQMELADYQEDCLSRLSVLTDEYSDNILAGASYKAFFEEHSKLIIKQNAIEAMAEL